MQVRDLLERGNADITTGPFGTQLQAAEYVESGTPVINVRNVGFGDIRVADLEFVNEETTARLERHRLKPGDIVFGRKGAVERHALIREAQDGWIQGSDCIRLRLDPSVYLPEFASLALRTEWHQQWMKNLCSFGATMASLNQDIVALIDLPDIPIEWQERIAFHLGAFDDLIENNRRRIEILEEMARLLYREWFVHFRFPGHEDVKLVDSELGPIPAEGVPLVRSMNVYDLRFEDDGLVFVDSAQAADLDRVTIEANDVLLNITGASVARCALAPPSVVGGRVNQHVMILRFDPREADPRIVALALSGPYKPKLLSIASSGATREALTKADIETFKILLPPPEIQAEYRQKVEPMIDLSHNLENQNQVLREARDLLLPRLVSGELDVSELELEGV